MKLIITNNLKMSFLIFKSNIIFNFKVINLIENIAKLNTILINLITFRKFQIFLMTLNNSNNIL